MDEDKKNRTSNQLPSLHGKKNKLSMQPSSLEGQSQLKRKQVFMKV